MGLSWLRYVAIVHPMAGRGDISRLFSERGLTNVEVAEFLGVTRQCVSAWRSGRNLIHPAIAKRLHEHFDLPLNVLRPDVWDAPGRDCRRRAA